MNQISAVVSRAVSAMFKTAAVAGVLAFSLVAKADVLPVEFQWCTQNDQYVCAVVYGIGSGGIEMGVQSDNAINERIIQYMGNRGRTLAMNVEGEVKTIKTMSGSRYSKLFVTSLEPKEDVNAPRPR